MSRLYWFIIDDEPEKKRDYNEYVYIVHRDKHKLEFVYKTLDLARKCRERLISNLPEEADSIYIRKMIVRTDYK